ncbi:probable feruloyl esterase A [Rutidosis leptorrhynchoides]|uniref:probable feruloyl esterase A n=1 Tax=Rutidosis leptorrhynchoides TaxID=125765 RepID=UPI003A99AFF8
MNQHLIYIYMERRWWMTLLIIMCLLVSSTGRGLNIKSKVSSQLYNHTLAVTMGQYASAVYMSDLIDLFTWTCSRCDGLTEGFEVIELIVDIQNCLQAFVGVADDLDAIVIAFRGTQETSIQNWIEDLFWKQLDFDYPGCTNGKVHHGFFNAYNNTTVRPGILDGVSRAREVYGDLKIMVTGHSMGGAMAAFCGLDLALMYGSKNVQVTTFGMPRIGNAAFASYYSEVVPNTFRVTHAHDLVPHLPPYYQYFPQKTYHHFPREVWLYNIGFGFLIYPVEMICDGSGEDPNCSRSVSGNSISDHLSYFGIEMGCDTSSKCKIVMAPSLASYGKIDDNGNFALSKTPTKFILKKKLNHAVSDQ